MLGNTPALSILDAYPRIYLRGSFGNHPCPWLAQPASLASPLASRVGSAWGEAFSPQAADEEEM